MTEVEERDILLAYRPWLRVTARELCLYYLGHARDAEELAQEGWISLWRALRKDDGSTPQSYWLKRCARSGMLHVLKAWIAQKRDVRKCAPVDTTPGEINMWTQLEAAPALTEIEQAYHDGEIRQAIERLPRAQRSYIERRFWHGWTIKALDIYFGNSHKIWKPAQDILKNELAHLR